MKKICLCVLPVLITVCLLSSGDVRAFSGSQAESLVQTEEPRDFEDWYPPDEAYQTNDTEKPAQGDVTPKGGENEPRVAPDEEKPPKEH